MPKTITTKIFIEKASDVHGDLYDYSKSIYVSAKTKVLIGCKIHGEFEQYPNVHYKSGCPKCGDILTANAKRITNDEYIKIASKTHNNIYSYELTEYTTIHEKIKVICNDHGVFKPSANNHLRKKSGCPICGGRAKGTTEKFIKDAIKIHGDRFIYDYVDYCNVKKHVVIVCKEHGEFIQSPQLHLLSSEPCPSCRSHGGWRYENWIKAAEKSKYFDSYKLYIIECWDTNERFFKIGRTFLPIGMRFRYNKEMPYKWKVIREIKGDARYICDLEHELQQNNSHFKYKPLKSFHGFTECFSKLKKDK